MNLRDLGEDRLLERLLPKLPSRRDVVAGAGDDCALVQFGSGRELLVLKTDCVVQGVHFTSDAKPGDVGWKAMARVLSDFAAMAAAPQFALVTLLAPPEIAVRYVEQVYRGLGRAAAAFDVAIVGGETSATPGPLAISVSLTGFVQKERWISRSGGKPGDELFVTGTLGGSIRGKHLRFMPRIAEAQWLAANFSVTAMMDLSDGLGADLPRLARASGVGFEVDEQALPRTRGCSIEQAISDGEDYELLLAVSANESQRLQSRWRRKFPRLPLTRIGQLTSSARTRKMSAGYVHFQQS